MTTLLTIALLFLNSFVPADTVELGEYRAFWVTRSELHSKANVDAIIENAVQNNFNAVFVQVCGRGLAFYESELLPKDARAAGWDPLAQIIEQAKLHDIEVHAWVNALYVWSNPRRLPLSKNHIVNRHPDWVQRDASGRSMRDTRTGLGYFLDPSVPGVFEHVTDVYKEIIDNYDIDGIHFDYIRYPSAQWGFSDSARQVFVEQLRLDPVLTRHSSRHLRQQLDANQRERLVTAWADYRRGAISAIVAEVYQYTIQHKPEVKVSAAVIANYEYAKRDYSQDWVAWLEDGIVDMVVPMAYTTNDKLVERQVRFAAQNAAKHSRLALAGLGAWRRQAAEIGQQISYSRLLREDEGLRELAGVVLFSYDGISKKRNFLPFLKQHIFAEKKQVPNSLFRSLRAEKIKRFSSNS